ncbi:methionine adenosyltransferase [Candidatus Magnetominusculus dajiuhuensis]|uniref:methionine adenosyltransferase n=1 Tax=Candidatus Magnetominusculus dajiuhuensis TaxID=3137712 RepID=UPI003B430211
MNNDFMLSSESVTAGHPDKLCDQISDAIVDHALLQDPNTRIVAECAVSTSIVFIASMFESKAVMDFANIARKVIRRIGYTKKAFNDKTCSIITSLKELSPDKNGPYNEHQMSDSEMDEVVVKNNATIFGFACNQTPAFIPLTIWLAHKIAIRLDRAHLDNELPYLAPDGKVQVGVEYKNRHPYRIHSIIVQACQESADVPTIEKLRDDVRARVIDAAFADEKIGLDDKTRIFINPDGAFVTGGPASHSGLTGRKKAMDTYGGYARNSDAALSGKGPLRIDRVGAYMARYAAKNVVAAELAHECEVQVSYSIGLARPVSIQVDTYGTGKIKDQEIEDIIGSLFDFRLPAILKKFNLRYLPNKANGGMFYQKLAVYGHFGRTDMELPWEVTDMRDKILPFSGR